MDATIITQIAEKENITVKDFTELSGGSINAVYRLKTNLGSLVLKVNSAKKYSDMFKKEAHGLKLLQSTGTFKIPNVHAVGSLENKAYLLLEHFSTAKDKSVKDWKGFAKKLAELHQNTAPKFGLDEDNYIGSLPQYNQTEITNAGEFYIEKRLKPQFELANKKGGFSFGRLDKMYEHIKYFIPDEKPALIHGDLWNENYLFGQNNVHVLIDPAVSYAIREMDLAMMKLFGGFPDEVFDYYQDFYPLKKGWNERIDIWQLYYLLVHLNLFGQNYFHPITRIMRRFR